jgi:DNA repair exonuclease SbcCD ATPase subunit
MVKIAHTADVHWRGLSRHDEYRQVFEAFVKDCKKNKVDHIFVGGDIFHTKTTGISPEYIDQLTWWLETMVKIAEVHLTLGNHDGNLTNLSRQDAVSPIVQALNNPKIHVYKKSGAYEFHPGYNWCVYSLFDEEGWKSVTPQSGKVNIACYHGPVQGSVTEVGWEMEGMNLEFFKEYPFVFLGDIHQMQHLGYRDCLDGKKKPWISYPGTPIQQNYAEELEHGYLLWDIDDHRTWDVSFKKLPNPKPYVTIPWNGSIEDLISSASKHPDGTRFRIRSSDALGQKDFSLINESLRSVKSATEVTFKSDFIVDKSVVKTNSVMLEKADLRNSDVLLKLIKDYYSGTQVTEEQWKIVSEQVKSCLSAVTAAEETVRNSKWSLRYLEFDNMFAYGEGNSINFDKLNGIVGVFGPNRIGKSSIIGTLMYSLFNATDRGPMKNIHVCNIRKPYCSSKAIINHDGVDYVVERQTTKSENKKGVINASTALNVFKIRDDGEADDLAGEQRTDTEKVIRALIGNQEDFMMTSLAAQGETNQFISQGSTRRRAVLSRFLDLDIFDKMHESSNRELATYKSQLKNYPDREWSSIIQQGQNAIIEIDKRIGDLHQQIKEKQQVISQLQIELSKHAGTPVTKIQVETFAKQLANLEQCYKNCLIDISHFESEIEESNKKLKTIELVKSENDVGELRSQLAALKDLESSLSSLNFIYEKENTLFAQQKKSLKILDEVPCGDDYPTCKFIKDAHVNKSKLSDQQVKVEQAQKKLEKAKKAFEEAGNENLVARLEKMEKLMSLETKLLLDISKKENELEKSRLLGSSQELELKNAKEKLKTLEEALKNEDNAEAVSIKSNIEDISRAIDSLTADKIDAATRKGKLTANLEKVNEEKNARNSLLEKMKVHELVTVAFSKKGLPLIITKSQLPVINAEIAKILSGIVDFTIELENDESTDSSEIYINYGDSRRIIELCSGMEKTIASLAIRVAMINVSSLPQPDIFIIDEGFGTLDDASVEACNRLLVSLKRHFKTILIITHVDGVKDIVDHVLEITKNEKDSRVVFGAES